MTELYARHRAAKVTILECWVDPDSQIEPLKGVLVLTSEVLATADIVNTSQVGWINFDAAEVVVQCILQLILLFLLFWHILIFRTALGSDLTVRLNDVTFSEPELCILQNVRLNFVLFSLHDFQVKIKIRLIIRQWLWQLKINVVSGHLKLNLTELRRFVFDRILRLR